MIKTIAIVITILVILLLLIYLSGEERCWEWDDEPEICNDIVHCKYDTIKKKCRTIECSEISVDACESDVLKKFDVHCKYNEETKKCQNINWMD